MENEPLEAGLVPGDDRDAPAPKLLAKKRPLIGWLSLSWLVCCAVIGGGAFVILSEAGQGRIYTQLAPINQLMCQYLGCAHLNQPDPADAPIRLITEATGSAVTVKTQAPLSDPDARISLQIHLTNGDQLTRQLTARELSGLTFKAPEHAIIAAEFKPLDAPVAIKTVSR